MSTPKPGKDGLRRYGQWAGNTAGSKEDVQCCIEEIQEPGRGIRFYQCTRKRGHGPDGLYCQQHTPDAAKARREANEKRQREKWGKEMWERHRARNLYRDALQKIADGHNDPRAVAAEALAKTWEDAS